MPETSTQNSTFGTICRRLGNSLTFKFLLLGIIALLLLIPSCLINVITAERQYRYQNVVREIGEKWGGAQTLIGPVLQTKTAQQDKSFTYSTVAPQSLQATCVLTPEIRHRGIYQAVLYSAKITLRAQFIIPHKLTRLSLGISDLTGLAQISGTLGGQKLHFTASDREFNGICATLDPARYPAGSTANCEIELLLNGSQKFYCVPVGASNEIKLQSTWTDPKFTGSLLPAKRTVNAQGFSAEYYPTQLNTLYPETTDSWKLAPGAKISGVELKITAGTYAKVERLIKYAFLLISLTLFTLLVIEQYAKKSIAGLQYLVCGTTMVMSFLLILALGEHLNFIASFCVSAVLGAAMLGLYAVWLLSGVKPALVLTGIILLLYGMMLLLLECEDYALLIGTTATLLALGGVMVLTAKINRSKD